MISRRAFLRGTLGLAGLAALSLSGCGEGFQDAPFEAMGSQTFPDSPGMIQGRLRSEGLLVGGPDGSLYQVDSLGYRLRRLDANGETVWEVGDVGAGDGVFNYPFGLDFDAQGDLYVVDLGNAEIDVLDSQGFLLRTLGREHLNALRSLAFHRPENTIFATDPRSHRVVVLSTTGQLLHRFGETGFGERQLNAPGGLVFDRRGDLHVVDSGNARIQVFSSTGSWLRSYGRPGSGLGEFEAPGSAVYLEGPEEIWVADPGPGFITSFDLDGNPLGRFVPRLPGGLNLHPITLTLGLDNVVMVSGVPQFQGS